LKKDGGSYFITLRYMSEAGRFGAVD